MSLWKGRSDPLVLSCFETTAWYVLKQQTQHSKQFTTAAQSHAQGAGQAPARPRPECGAWEALHAKAGNPRRLTCEGGGIDDDLGVKRVCVEECIGQDESPLGICVIHLQSGESKRGGGQLAQVTEIEIRLTSGQFNSETKMVAPRH